MSKYEYWFCHNCGCELSPERVTNDEKCDTCGHPPEWITGELPDYKEQAEKLARAVMDMEGCLDRFTSEANYFKYLDLSSKVYDLAKELLRGNG